MSLPAAIVIKPAGIIVNSIQTIRSTLINRFFILMTIPFAALKAQKGNETQLS
jgi:hypothetical protein